MATTYQILRKEVSQDRNGNNEVFVNAEIYDDEVGVINYPKWYRGTLAENIIADESTLDTLIQPILGALVAQKRIDMTRVIVAPDREPEINPRPYPV